MRCATLADALVQAGAEVTFACWKLPGHLNDWLNQRGYAVIQWESDSPDFIAERLETALNTTRFDWLVVDHYGLDASWEEKWRHHVDHILVVDDLANRPHDCDYLLDQNFFRQPECRYQELVPEACRLLLGPDYSLLRPDFAEVRAAVQSSGKRVSGQVRRLQIFFGGSDPTGETLLALEAVSRLAWPELTLDVIVGGSNPLKEAIEAACCSLPNARFYCQTREMAQLMGEADLAIAAGGTATWERLCVGLPALVLSVAENQEQISREVAEAGAQIYLGRSGEISAVALESALRRWLSHPAELAELSQKAFTLVDGLGAIRVADAMWARMS